MSQIRPDHPLRGSIETDEAGLLPPRPYYELVRDDLARNIVSGKLRPGMVLLEGPIATLLGVSRGPVQRALELLAGKTTSASLSALRQSASPISSAVRPRRRTAGC